MSGSLWIAVASIYREWSAIAECLSRGDKLAISARETSLFLRVASAFGNRVWLYDPQHGQRSLIETCNDRQLEPEGYPLHCQTKARIARTLTSLSRCLRASRDTLYINDWTFQDLVTADPSGLTLFGRAISKGAFPVLRNDRLVTAAAAYDAQRIDDLSAEQIGAVLTRFQAVWPAPLMAVVEDEIRIRYRKLRNYLIRCHALFSDLLDNYRPSRIVLSGESLEPHTLLMQMAQARSMEVWYLNDGYLPSVPIGVSPALRREDGREWLISKILTYGRAAADQLQMNGFPSERISMIPPAFLSNIRSSSDTDSAWDATIATWFPNHLNPESREEWTCLMACEVAELLLSLGFVRIAVKVKHRPESTIYIELQRRGLLSSAVTVIWEPFQQHLAKTCMVVGGLSTGVLEAFAGNVPYFIYEPFENGYSDTCVMSHIVDSNLVARTLTNLRENVLHKRQAVIRPREELFADSGVLPWMGCDA